MNSGASTHTSLAAFIAFCSIQLGKSAQSQMVILGDMSLGGAVSPVDSLADCLQLVLDAGAKKVLIPACSVGDISTIPPELFAKFQTSFYQDPVDAAFKALGVE